MAAITNELEKEFQKTYLALLQTTEDPESPSLEFQRLPDLWRKSRENESRLAQRCRELQTQLAANKARTLATAARAKENQATIASLKKEIENAWKMVDDAHEKDQKSRDTIQHLQQEVEQLSRIVEHTKSLSLTQERLAELQRAKDELTEMTEALQTEIGDLKDKLTSANTRISQKEEEEENLKNKLNQAIDDVQGKDSQLQREVRQREKAEIDLRQVRAGLKDKEKTVEMMKTDTQERDAKIQLLERFLDESKMASDKMEAGLETLQLQAQKLSQDNEVNQRRVSRLSDENQRITVELKLKEDEYVKLYSENVKLIKLRDSLYVQVQKVREQNSGTNHQAEMLRRTLNALEKEAEAAKKLSGQQEKVVDDLQREKTLINQNLLKTVDTNERQAGLLKVYEHAKRSIDQELVLLKEETAKQAKLIAQLEKERDRVQSENGELKSKVSRLSDDVRAKDTQLFDCHRKITEIETKFQQQKSAYDVLKKEKSACSKNLSECQDEANELRRRLKLSAHHVEHLKEDVSTKESALFREQHDRQKLEKEKESLKFELEQTRNSIGEWKAKVEKLLLEERRLLKQFTNADEEKAKLQSQVEKNFHERNTSLSQLLEKNKEVCALRETVKILETSVDKKEAEYHALSDDFRLLKLEVKRLKVENGVLERSTVTFEDLQNKISSLEKELMTEKLKSKALETELQNPHNIHRWRRLAGSDPTTFELIQKTQILQKRLLAKAEVSAENRMRNLENEQKKMEGQREDLKRSHSAMADRYLGFQQAMRDKDKQIKSLTSEQEVYLSKLEACNREINSLKVELRDAKFKILIFRKSQTEDEAKFSSRTITPVHPPSLNSSQNTRKTICLGSGFRMMSAVPNSQNR